MRNYKSVGFNYTYILLYITVIGIIYESNGDFSFAYDNMYYLIVFLLMTIIISINEIIVDRAGIIKKFYLFPLKIKQLSWKEIKYYVDVDEEYSGKYGKTIDKRIWFINLLALTSITRLCPVSIIISDRNHMLHNYK